MNDTFLMSEYYKELAKNHTPKMSFSKSGMSFDDWKSDGREKLRSLLGIFPARADLCPRVIDESDEGDYIRRKIVMDVDEYTSMPAYVLIPKCTSGGRLPAILCVHGHGPFAKDSVVGLTSTPERMEDVRASNYNFAEQMARAGYVTIAPDLRGFGERAESGDPLGLGRDICNVNFLRGAILGIYPLTLNISDMMCCIDYLSQMPEVDSERIGMMGLSLGGTVTTFTTALDERIKCCDIISFVNPFDAYGIRDTNFCGSQIVPEIYRYFDTFDIAGMIAPRPCLMEMGRTDKTFCFDDLMKGYEQTKRIFDAASAGDRLFCDVHDGGHAFSGALAFDFFADNL